MTETGQPGHRRYTNAVVTGVSRGLGLAIARSLVERGLNVVGLSRTRPPAEVGFHWVEADLRRPEDITRAFDEARERHGPIDVLVNNAAGGRVHPFEDTAPAELRDLIELNLIGQILCARAAIPDMLRARHGLIVNIGSDWSRRYAPFAATYAAAKFGLLGFSGSLLREVKDRGVGVVCVMPGAIDTSWGGVAVEGSRDAESAIPPADLASIVAGLLDLPDHLLVHELMVHPRGQQGI